MRDFRTFEVEMDTMSLLLNYEEYSRMNGRSFSLVDADLLLKNPGIYRAADFYINDQNEVILNIG